MGRPSDKRRSARRPGSHERARIKKRTTWGYGIQRSGVWCSAWGAGTAMAWLGRKKDAAYWRCQSHHVGESNQPERRAKALGPLSEQAGVASGPQDALTGEQ